MKSRPVCGWYIERVMSSLLFIFLLCTIPGAPSLSLGASTPEKGDAQVSTEKKITSIADLIPKITQLRERSVTDEKAIAVIDVTNEAKKLSGREESAKKLEAALGKLRRSKSVGYDQLTDLKSEARGEADELAKVRKVVEGGLETLYRLQNEWSLERKRWKKWKTDLASRGKKLAIKPTFTEANRIISRMLTLIEGRLNPIIGVKASLDKADSRIVPIISELDVMLQAVREDIFQKSSPSIFSPLYYNTLKKGLWTDMMRRIEGIHLPGRTFFLSQGWIVALQLITSLFLIWGLGRYKNLIGESANLQFLLHRNVSAGFFMGISFLFPLYDRAPPLWRLFLWGLVCLTATRVVGCLISFYWKRWLMGLLAFLFFAIQFFRVFGLPQPLFRMYVTLVALGGFPLCLWRAKASKSRQDYPLFTWSLRVGAAILGTVLIAEIAGYSALATHLLDSTIKTIFLFLLSWLFVLMGRGIVEFLVHHSYMGRITIIRRNRNAISQRISRVMDLTIGIIAFVLILVAWRIFETPTEAFSGIISYGISVGGQKFTLGNLLLAGVFLYGSFLISTVIQAILIHDIFPKRNVELGAGISIGRLVRYGLVFVGFLFALSALGFGLKNLVILTGALGVGIGFGLQNIANNFISGIILLFERPIKVGDIVQIEGEMGEVVKLGLRATVVRMFFHSEIIVPNNEMISTKVVNWTLTDRMIRLILPVGVAYGSDVPLVMKILEEVGATHPRISFNPGPQVIFIGFGDSSLDFELHAWLVDVQMIYIVKSELNQEIDRKFREEGVKIPFPQRDLHLKGGIEMPHPPSKKD